MCERTPLISLLISDYMFLLSKSLKWGTGRACDVFVSYLAEYINMFMMSYTAPPNTSDPTVMSKLTVGCAQWTFYDNQVTEYFLGFCACVCLLWVFFVVVVMCIYCGRAYNKKNLIFYLETHWFGNWTCLVISTNFDHSYTAWILTCELWGSDTFSLPACTDKTCHSFGCQFHPTLQNQNSKM